MVLAHRHGVACRRSAPVHLTPGARSLSCRSTARDATRGDYWLREASAVIVTDDLVSLGILAMSRDERLRAFETLRVPATAPLSHATVIRVGQIVGAVRVIIGSAAISGEMLTVRARSILPDGGQISAEVVETGPLADPLPSTVASPNVSLSGCRVRLRPHRLPSTSGGIRTIHQRTAGRGTGDEAFVFARCAAAVAHARAGASRDVGRPQCAGRASERAWRAWQCRPRIRSLRPCSCRRCR